MISYKPSNAAICDFTSQKINLQVGGKFFKLLTKRKCVSVFSSFCCLRCFGIIPRGKDLSSDKNLFSTRQKGFLLLNSDNGMQTFKY